MTKMYVSFFIFVVSAVSYAWSTRNEPEAGRVAPYFSALCGLLTLGMLDSLFDFPSLEIIFYFLGACL